MSCHPSFQSTKCMCGSFPEPIKADLGQCFPRRLKIDCDTPVIPPSPCDDDQPYSEYDPNFDPPFTIVSNVYDTLCSAVLDTEGLNITGPIS